MKRIPHDGSALLWSALILAVSAVSAGCSSSHESSGGDGGGADGSAGAHDGGGPAAGSDGAPSSCPATYADVPQFSPCSGSISCSYFGGQFNCGCVNVSTKPLSNQWECVNNDCICSRGNDAGCINKPCTTEADCPSGQHCGRGYAANGNVENVCSVGCGIDGGEGQSPALCPVETNCVGIAP